MPDLIRHPDVVPTKVGNHFKDWVPVFTGNPGFRLEFIPMKIGAGMTILIECQFINRLYLLYSRHPCLGFLSDKNSAKTVGGRDEWRRLRRY